MGCGEEEKNKKLFGYRSRRLVGATVYSTVRKVGGRVQDEKNLNQTPSYKVAMVNPPYHHHHHSLEE